MKIKTSEPTYTITLTAKEAKDLEFAIYRASTLADDIFETTLGGVEGNILGDLYEELPAYPDKYDRL